MTTKEVEKPKNCFNSSAIFGRSISLLSLVLYVGIVTKGNSFLDPKIIEFLNSFHKLVLEEALQNGSDRNLKVVDFLQPEELKPLLHLPVNPEPETAESILELCRRVIKYSVKTGHPRFFNQLYSGIDPFSLAGSWLTDALNTNIHTYEVAGVFILVEQYLIDKLCDIVGYKDGDGLFCPGGSFSNMMAIHLARFQRDSTVREKGLYQSPRLRLYCSKEAHYSMEKAALFLGIGTDNVIGISTDSRGCMLPDILDMKILEDKKTKGFEPTIVMATCGTTVLGAFDPLPEIAEICKRHGVWLHVDACLGGGVLLSKKFKHRMAGIERSDSIAWNFHKMSHANIQCSVLLLKEKGLLNKGNGLNAEYLFQPDKCYDVSYDIGDRTVQCGRRVDALKLWIMWKALGDNGMADNIENAFKNAEYFQKLLSETEGFRLVLPEFQSTNICFWYIPPSLRGQMETKEWWERVGKVAPEIKKKMTVQGTMLIGYQPLSSKDLVNFFRIVILNPLCDFCDMDFVVSEIDRLGKDFIP